MESMREEEVSKKVLSLLENIWDHNQWYPQMFGPCFEGFLHSQDPSFLRSCCFLAISMLETRRLSDHELLKSLIEHLHSLAEPAISLSVMERLSQSVSRQEALRSKYFLLFFFFLSKPSDSPPPSSQLGVELFDPMEEWMLDLGSHHWIAFEAPHIWGSWLSGIKGILSEYSYS